MTVTYAAKLPQDMWVGLDRHSGYPCVENESRKAEFETLLECVDMARHAMIHYKIKSVEIIKISRIEETVQTIDLNKILEVIQ